MGKAMDSKTLIAPLDTAAINLSVDLREYIGREVVLYRASGERELCGPCPRCGGTDRLHVQADRFFCRHCYPLGQGGRHDAIDYVMWRRGVRFREACLILTGDPVPTDRPRLQRVPSSLVQAEDWGEHAGETLYKAQKFLRGPLGEVGRSYLVGRGLLPITWDVFAVGYLPAAVRVAKPYQVPALVIPWLRAGSLSAIRYRFLRPVNEEKVRSYTGSSFAGLLFGAQVPDPENPTGLVLCEGEINAMSVWQACQGLGLVVRSLGSQDSTLSPEALAEIRSYPFVLCWLDEGERARRIQSLLPGAAGRRSVGDDGIKRDANDWLQEDEGRGDLLRAIVAGSLARIGLTLEQEEIAPFGLEDVPMIDPDGGWADWPPPLDEEVPGEEPVPPVIPLADEEDEEEPLFGQPFPDLEVPGLPARSWSWVQDVGDRIIPPLSHPDNVQVIHLGDYKGDAYGMLEELTPEEFIEFRDVNTFGWRKRFKRKD